MGRGFLVEKLGAGFFASWKQRWFVVNSDSVQYAVREQ